MPGMVSSRGRLRRCGSRLPCAQRPNDTRTARHRAVPRGGRGLRPQACWRRKPGPLRGSHWGDRCAGRARRNSRSRPPGCRGSRSTRVSGMRFRGYRAADRALAPAPRQSRRPWRPVVRMCGRRPRAALAESDLLQGVHQRVGVVAELDRTYALVGRRHRNRTERALADREADHVAVPAGAVLRRRHAEEAVGCRIEAAVRSRTRRHKSPASPSRCAPVPGARAHRGAHRRRLSGSRQ